MKRGLYPPMALLLLLTACTPAGQVTPSPLPTLPNGGTVQTDWSQLGEPDRALPPVGGRWYQDYTDELIPSGEYGALIPYAGLRLMDDWPAYDGCLYGLMTLDGRVVTDPVYSRAAAPQYYDAASGQWRCMPLLVLKRGDPGAGEDAWDPARCAVAAADGSWCTPFDYSCTAASGEGLLLFQESRLTAMGLQGEILGTWTAEEMGLAQEEFDSMRSGVIWGEGWGGRWYGDYISVAYLEEGETSLVKCFCLSSQQTELLTEEAWRALEEENWGAMEEGEQTTAIPGAERIMDALLGSQAPGLLQLEDYQEDGVTCTYYREDGTPLPQLTLRGEKWYRQVDLVGGLIEVLDWNTATYYDLESLECVFRTYLGYEGD